MLFDSEVRCPGFFLNFLLSDKIRFSECSLNSASDNSKAFYRLAV